MTAEIDWNSGAPCGCRSV